MEDNFWYWIIGLVIYFFLQKKKKDVSEPEGENSPDSAPLPQQGRTGRPVTFEDLLRDIQSKRAPEPAREPEPEFDYEDFDDEPETVPPSQPLEQVEFQHKDSLYSSYEKARKDAFQHESLEETVKLEDTDVRYSRFKEYEKDERPAYVQELAREFADREKLRKAFILKEILDRKY